MKEFCGSTPIKFKERKLEMKTGKGGKEKREEKKKTSWKNNCNKVFVIQRRRWIVTDYKKK